MPRRNSAVGFFDDTVTKDVIRKIAAAKKLTIFTGAGIAADLQIPNWSNLVARLLHNLELPRHDNDAARAHSAVQTAIDSFHQLPTASIVDAAYRRNHSDAATARAKRNEDIANILYRSDGQQANEQVPEDALAIYVLRLAIAKRLADCDVHVVTTNYDDSLEHIAKSRQDLGLGDLGADGVPVLSNWDTEGDLAQGVPVSHVHGLIPRSGPAEGEIVFSEREYIEWDQQSPWRDYLAKRLAGDGVTLFVGASLRDYNIAAMLKRFSHGNVYALLPVEDEIRQAAEREVAWSPTTSEYATMRGHHLGVQVLRPDFFGQVCQFLNEVAISAGLEAPDYSKRLRKWSRTWSATEPFDVELLVQRCRQLRDFAMSERGRLNRATHIKAEVWVRDDPDSRELTLYSTSQTVVLPGEGYWPHTTQIGHQSRYSAVSAFAARCATEGRVYYRNDGRWTHFLAVPIILSEAPYFELPVGVMTVLLHAPDVSDSLYFGDPHSADMRDLSVRMKELGQEFLRPLTSS